MGDSLSHGKGSFKYFKHGYRQTIDKRVNIKNWLKYANTMDSNRVDEQSSDSASSYAYVWRKYSKILISVCILGFGLNWVRMTRNIILTFHGTDLQLSQSQIGNINSLSFVPDSCMFPFAGILMDKFGRKVPATIGLLLFIVALSVISFTNAFGGLAAVAVIFGFADGITSGLLMTVSADMAPIECKSQFIAQSRTIVNIPKLLVPILVGTLCSNVSLFSATMMSASIGLLALIWTVFVMKEPKDFDAQTRNLQNEMMLHEQDEFEDQNGNILMMSSLDDELAKNTKPATEPSERL